jgi:hypothetical protein
MQGVIDLNKFFFHDLLPFVDYELFELFKIIPPRYKIGHELYQQLFKRHFPELAAVPWAHTGHNLYASEKTIRNSWRWKGYKSKYRLYVRRLTHGRINPRNPSAYQFRDIWLRTNRDFRAAVLPILRNVDSCGLDYFDQKKIDLMLDGYDRGKYYFFETLARLCSFVLWFRMFLNEEYEDYDLYPQAAPAQKKITAEG